MKKFLLVFSASAFLFCVDAQPSFGVKVVGKGNPIIFIPGLNGSGDVWNTTVAHYKNNYTCYVITLAGFAGQPPVKQKDSLLLLQRDQIIQYIKDKHLYKPVITGFSFGGVLALWVATSAPDLVGPVIDVDGLPFESAFENANINKDSIAAIAQQRHDFILKQTPEAWQRIYQSRNSPKKLAMAKQDLKALVTDTTKIPIIIAWDKATDLRSSYLMQTEMSTLDLRNELAKLKQPLLFLGSWKGWNDITTLQIATAEYQLQLAAAKNAKLMMSEEGKHFLMWDDYSWMIYEMDAFLKNSTIAK